MIFVKIFQTIYDSSIADDWQARVVFQDMLILADWNGVVDITPAAMQRRTNLPLEMILAAIPKLEGPDPTSRTQDKEGRRIERLDAHRNWGWKIVNYEKYRESVSKEMLRAGEAERKAAYRRKQRNGFPPVPPLKTDRDRDRDIEQTGKVPDSPGQVPDNTVKDGSSAKALRINKFMPPKLEEISLEATKAGISDLEVQKFFNYYEANGWRVGRNPMKSWKHALINWKLNIQNYGSKTDRANNRQTSGKNIGTLNEGKSSQYRGVGRLVPVPTVPRPAT